MKIRTSVSILFVILIVIFSLQNTEIVTVKLWFWEANISRALMIVISIAAGIVFGMILPSFRKRTKKLDDKEEKKDTEDKERKEAD